MTNIQMTTEILNSLDRCGTEVLKKRRGSSPEIMIKNLIYSLLEYKSTTEASKYLSISRSTISKILNKSFNILEKGPRTRDWRVWLIDQTNYKYCHKCDKYLDKDLFSLNNISLDKLSSCCKDCASKISREHYQDNKEQYKLNHKTHYENNKSQYIAKDAKRRASKIQRTVVWADLQAIKEIYRNCPKGYHVDHIIPLQGKNISGLHIETNLQYLTAEENIKKGNKY